MSKRLMPTYLVKFLEKIYDGEIPSNFGKRMVSRQFIARAKELYDTLGGKNPSDYSRRMVNEYLIKFFNEIEIVEYDDDDISQTKAIPSDLVYPACRIDSIGGMSYKSENLINESNFNDAIPTIQTFSNGILTSNGIDSRDWGVYADSSFKVYLSAGTYQITLFDRNITQSGYQNLVIVKEAGGIYTSSQNLFTSESGNFQFNIETSGYYGFKIKFIGSFKLSLVSGTVKPTEFKEGFTGIRDSAVTAVKSYGANVFNFNENVVSVSTSTTPLSINLNIDATTKTIGANATGTYSRAIIKLSENLITGKTYTFSFNLVTNVAVGRIALSSTGSHIDDKDYGFLSGVSSGSKTLTFTAVNNKLYLHLYLTTSNSSCDMTMSNIMLNYGSTALPYTPYKGLIDTYTVPSAITSLEGYGQGINSTVYNNVDFASGKYTKKVGVFDLGSLNWSGANGFFQVGFATAKQPATTQSTATWLLCSLYEPDTAQNIFQNVNDKRIGLNPENKYLQVRDNSYTTASAFKTAMSGVLLYYELATPVETNITENAPLLEVESGGTVVLENEYNNDVPSEVTTWIKES